MRILPIILTLLLTLAWAYTSWYWYTCDIKWFCEEKNTGIIEKNEDSIISQEDVFLQRQEQDDIWGRTGAVSQAQKLSAEDVLSENKILQDEGLTPEITITVGSGETSTGVIIEDSSTEEEIIQNSYSLCDTPLVGPISFGGNNNKQEVEKLEIFLDSQGKLTQKDGIYGQEEFEAIKEFQLKYKEEILDPWDIKTPTGYVWKTTIKKIQAIACE